MLIQPPLLIDDYKTVLSEELSGTSNVLGYDLSNVFLCASQ